jgi:hypothetical protein
MPLRIIEKSAVSILNFCAKHLTREQGGSAEAWRFPIVEPFPDKDAVTGAALNAVTFVYDGRREASTPIGVVGTFATLYEPIPLQALQWHEEDTGYRAVTVLVPEAEVHTYRFFVGDEAVPDPINPQRVPLDDGSVWSRFFTEGCRQPLSLERWQQGILARLVAHILPFRSREAQKFLEDYYYKSDRAGRDRDLSRAYRLDDQVGIVNFIDNILAREEAHRLNDYRLCLSIIDAVLRRRNPFIEPAEMPRDMFIELYEQMARDDVPGWDYSRYKSPRFFLQLLRRHAFTGAFCHPRYGGNAGAAAWAFLSERYTDGGHTLFDWRLAIEKPFGTSSSYQG